MPLRRCSLWGWRKGVPGGAAFHHCEGRLRSGAFPLPTARPLGGLLGSATHVLWARVCGCGGPSLSPWPACPVGAACRGGGGGPSPGGWPATVVRGVWCQALSSRPPVLWSGRPGFRDPGSPVRSVQAWGPSTGPTACALAGRRRSLWGWRKNLPGGGSLHHCEGRLRSGAVPPPTARPLGWLLGSATHVLWPRVCGCGGPTLSPWPACPVRAACRGAAGGPSPGRVACHCCEGRLVSAAVPPPAARPLERAARVPRPVCPWCGRCGPRNRAPAPRRAPLRAGVARREGGGRASPEWVPSAVVRGVWGQALPLPRLPALWAGCQGSLARCCGRGCRCVPHYPLAVGAGGAGGGTRHRPHSARSCVLWGRHEGARGGRLLPWCGASGDGRSPTPDLSSVRACGRGPLPTGCGCGGCGRGDPSPTPQRALLGAVGRA